MALRWTLLLLLTPLLAVEEQEEPDPNNSGEPQETEMCQRPQWDSGLQLAPDQDNYKKNEEVMLSCPEGFQPSFTKIKCSSEVQSISHRKPVYREVWRGRDSRGGWVRIRSNVECIEVLQVVPGTLEISSTSIKLNWTCRLPDACQRMRATCRLAGPSSPPCEAEEVKGEETLHGQKGTFTCPPLQPFTDYSVTISLPPSTVLYTRLLRTKETVPDKPKKLWLDPSTGSLRWKLLPSCKGEIIGYQLNITTRSARDGSFLEMERLRLNSSVTEYPLPEHSPGSSYAEKFTCVCYSFSVDVCKLNTRIPVDELLEALKRFKRAEIEAEQTEDESVDRHGAGRLREYEQLSSTLLHPCDAGKELCNQSKNRYKSIIPYDHCRVVLQPSDMGNGYINASYMDSYRSPHFFIAAQGPLPGTVVDFWQMVWQEKTSVIVMLTSLVEQNKTKCEQYWPEQEQVYGDFTVTLSNTRTTTGLVTRIFCLQKAGCALPRVVEQFHYLLWPDHGVPRNPAQLLCLVEVVNKRVLEAPAGPVLVHCSAGIGRTGTFIALDFLLKMGKAEGEVDVFHCVQRLREQRVSMVQTKSRSLV
ncbi:PREDICTED: receptor-type tyrosine-protein phosphatase mu-like [Pygoscelis adeliae]|uniref:receptor-type tyrosine-protein phosphatase mu-like n=1 Tax=Pygoscelis adeliae TaxID=9238 RepID=UPI0004F50961|nr:PREDICTED: receptor-type tyrosine-protein phosphatase mu-like [Pygoscelis adeliae]